MRYEKDIFSTLIVFIDDSVFNGQILNGIVDSDALNFYGQMADYSVSSLGPGV